MHQCDSLNCSNKSYRKINNIFYCNNHYNEIALCKYILRNGKQCSNKSITEGLCKRHHTMSQKKQCEYILRNKKQCSNRTLTEINSTYFCKIHIPNHICAVKNCNFTSPNRYCDTHISFVKEKNEIMDIIQKIKNMSIRENKHTLRKDIHKILLKVHPDKCKNPLINSNDLTVEMTNLLR